MPATTLAWAGRRDEHEDMRYESSVTSVSWIPSEAFDGIYQFGIEAVGHYDDPLPDVPQLAACRNGGPPTSSSSRQPAAGLDRCRRIRSHHRLRLRSGRLPDRLDDLPARRPAALLPGRRAARPAPGAGTRGRLGPVRPDRRRPGGRSHAQEGAAAALRAVEFTIGLDHPVADPARRRPGRAGPGRCQPVSPALGLRRWRAAVGQVGADRLPQLVRRVLRPLHPPGANKIPRPWSPPWRPRWNGPCPPS